MRALSLIDSSELVTVTGGVNLDKFISGQRHFAKAELKGAVCDNKAIGLGRHVARGLYGKPTNKQTMQAINAISDFCRSLPDAPQGATKIPG